MLLYNPSIGMTFDMTKFDVFGITAVDEKFAIYAMKKLSVDPKNDAITMLAEFDNESDAKNRYLDIMDSYAHLRCDVYDVSQPLAKRSDKGIL